MQRIFKTIDVENGKLYALINENRVLFAECKGEIEIIEHSMHVPVLGKGNIIDKREAVLLVTFEHMPKFALDVQKLLGFAFSGDVQRSDGKYSQLNFANLELITDLDLTAKSNTTFAITCSEETLNMLKNL